MSRKNLGATLLAGLAFAAVLVTSLTMAQQPDKADKADKADGRKVFTNSVVPLPPTGPARHGLIVNAPKRDHSKEKMDVLFSLAIPKEAQAELEQKVLAGETISPDELLKEYSAKPEDVQRLRKWLEGEGLKEASTTPDNTGIYVTGTVGQLAKSLHVTMVRVTAPDGVTYTAAQNAPSLPADIGASVQAIIGLQPFRQFTKHSRIRRSAAASGTATVPGYLVKQVLKAYNADALKVTGKGQRIGILIDTLPADADTAHFWKQNGLPAIAGRVEKVNVKNLAHLPPPDGEESMDTQWSSGIARDAKVRVYAAGTLQFVDLDRALDRIIADAMKGELRQVSISLGLGEQFLSPNGAFDGEIQIEQAKFVRLAALGVNVFISSGDAGSNPDATGHGTGAETQAEWMATSPFAVGVGGTTLHLGGNGNVADELGWPLSGGGMSKVFARPVYQKKLTVMGDRRLVPDVSLLADPDTGAYVRLHGHDLEIGGTSLSAPIWAGFCALINEARTNAGKPALPFLNPVIYPLQGTACFRDIDGGTSNGAYQTGPGYDMVTGVGVPHVKNLVDKLSQ